MAEVLEEKRTAQDDCIEKHDGKWLVIAGPGTGKTYTVVERIHNMINGSANKPPIPAESILCLTFSDTAAKEMRQRIGETHPVDIFTYHSFCKLIIDEHSDLFGLENPTIIDDDVKHSIITKCIDEMMKNSNTQLVGFNNEKNNPYSFIKEILDGISNIKMERIKADSFFYNIENHVAWKPHLTELQKIISSEENLRTYLMTNVEPKRQQFVTKSYEKIQNREPLSDKEYERLEDWEKKKLNGFKEEIASIERNITKMNELWKLYERYEEIKSELNYIDFYDMINKVLDKFEDDSCDLLDKIAQKYEYVIVDEYQDTNTSQNDIVFNLAKKCSNIFVVGDDDQIIYTFQGAHLDTIQKFLEMSKKDESISKVSVKCFTDNYRSTQPVLDVAKALADLQDDNFHRFMVDKGRKHEYEKDTPLKLRFLSQCPIVDDKGEVIVKALVSKNKDYKDIKDPVEFCIFNQKSDERDYIVNQIIEIKKEIDEYNKTVSNTDEQKRYSDIAILTYSNDELTEYADYLKANDVPVEITGGKNIFDITSVNIFISYLQFLCNPEKYYDKILSFLLQKPFHIDPKDYMEICSVKSHYKTLLENIEDYIERKEHPKSPDDTPEYKPQLKQFLKTYYYLRDYITCENYKTSLLEIGNRTGIFDYYFNQDTINQFENEKGINKLLELADGYFDVNTNEKKSFTLFVEYMSKMLESKTKIKLDKEDKPTNAVQLSTYHSSKGREFEYVFMPYLVLMKWDMIEMKDIYSIPQTPVEGESYEEFLDKHLQSQYLDKIKLLYVGMTRTKRKLFLSYADVGGAYGKISWFFERLLSNREITEGENPKLVLKRIDSVENKNYQTPTSDYDIDEHFRRYIEPYLPHSFSITGLNKYRNCPKDYFLAYILKMKSHGGDQDNISYGRATHAAFEEAIKYVMDNKKYPSADYVKDIFNKKLGEFEVVNPENTKASAEEKIFGEKGYYNEYFVKLADADEIPKDAKFEASPPLDNKKNDRRIYAEYKLTYEMDMPDEWKTSIDDSTSKIILNGSIDRLDKDVDGKYIIYDYKTGENCDGIAPGSSYFYQMVFYKYVLEKQNPGIEVKECYFLYPIEKNGNHKIMVHEKFTKEIKSKGIVEDVFGDKVKELMDTIGNIRKMNFEKPKSANCIWCNYKFICDHRLV